MHFASPGGDEYGDVGVALVNGNASSASMAASSTSLGGAGKAELMTVQITKGAMGFGFTIADSAHGQKVKTILDRPRCKNLAEGDILVDINAIDMRVLSHAQVVQVRPSPTPFHSSLPILQDRLQHSFISFVQLNNHFEGFFEIFQGFLKDSGGIMEILQDSSRFRRIFQDS